MAEENNRSAGRPDLDYTTNVVLDTLRAFWQRNGWFPSMRELGREMGWTSSSSTYAHIRQLERHGYLETYGPQNRYRLTTKD